LAKIRQIRADNPDYGALIIGMLALFHRIRGSNPPEPWLSMSGMLAQLTSEYPFQH